jgi:hypothetical protein
MKTNKWVALLLSFIFSFGGCSKSDEGSSAGGGQTTNHAVGVTKAGTGTGRVVSIPAGIDCGTDCAENVAPGTVLVFTPTADAGSTFAGWSGGGCSGTGDCSVTVNAAVNIVATFTSSVLTQKNLTVAKSGAGSGTVTSSPSGINCGADCSENYNQGTTVTLTAVPGGTSQFNGWSGGGCPGTGPCVVTLASDTVVTADFAPLPPATHALTVSRQGTGGGAVASSPAGIDCGSDCSETYTSGTVINLTATPDATSTFGGWSGACSGTGPCAVTMSQARSVTASFVRVTYLVAVSKEGNGSGTVSSTPAGINCGADCGENYVSGMTVTLVAAPSQYSNFAGWSGACSGTGTCVLTVNDAKTVTAQFVKKTFPLSVTLEGDGIGSVVSSPAGIDCGTSCQETFDAETVVTLTANPDDYTDFGGWSGACTGTGPCQVTLLAAANVTAQFNERYVNAPSVIAWSSWYSSNVTFVYPLPYGYQHYASEEYTKEFINTSSATARDVRIRVIYSSEPAGSGTQFGETQQEFAQVDPNVWTTYSQKVVFNPPVLASTGFYRTRVVEQAIVSARALAGLGASSRLLSSPMEYVNRPVPIPGEKELTVQGHD